MPDSNIPPRSVEQLDQVISRPTAAVLAALDRCPGDFVVLGAGGKMGFHVCRMLQRALGQLGRTNRVTAVSRFACPQLMTPFQDAGIPVVPADLSNASQLGSLPAVENVVFLAGIKFGTSGNQDLLERMNVTMPQLVADHYRQSRIVALSTGCVYSFTTPASGGSTESSETNPPGDYAQSCLQREAAFVSGSKRYGTPCSLVRLNYSVEPRYGVLLDIAEKVRSGVPIDLQTGHVNLIWQGDAVAQILQCLPLATTPPLIINITGSSVLAVRELAQAFGRRFSIAPKFTGIEAEKCWLSNNALAREKFGDPAVGLESMIDWVADWMERGGPTHGKPTQFQVRDGDY